MKKNWQNSKKNGQQLADENEKAGMLLCDLTDLYDHQAELRGRIKASYHILNNC